MEEFETANPKIAPSREVIGAHLDRLSRSDGFVQSDRLKLFLRHIVERTQMGDFDRLKETVIGVEVFGRAVGYDPKADAIVRVEAYRLRQKLKRYYEGEGQSEPLRVSLAKGSYVARIEVMEAPPPQVVAPTPVPQLAGRHTWLWSAAAGAVAMALLLFTYRWFGSPASISTPVIAKVTSDGGWSGDPVFSPDGSYILYSSDRGVDANLSLWRIPVSRGEPVRITNEPYDAVEADLSPDGTLIVYRSRRADASGLYVIPAGGGPPRLLVQGGSRPRFSPDGRWILYTVRNEQEWSPGRIYVIPTHGAAPQEIAGNFADAHYAIWASGGKAILFCGTRISGLPEAEHDWWSIPFPTGQPVKSNVFPNVLRFLQAAPGKVPPNQYIEMPGAWSDGRVYFASPLGTGSGVSLWRLPLSVENPEWSGSPAPERLTSGLALDQAPRVFRNQMVFHSGTYNVDLWSQPLDPKTGETKGSVQRLVSHPAADSFPAPSADGRYLAFASDRAGIRQIYVRNLLDRSERLVKPGVSAQDFPLVSRDGRRVAFRELRDPKVPILVSPLGAGSGAGVSADERGEVKTLCEDCGGPTDWSPGDRYLLFEPGATIAYVGRLNVASGTHEPLLTHPDRSLRGARYSPDGRWIAFYEETGKDARRLWLARGDRTTLPPEWTPLTDGNHSDVSPTWSPDGSLLYFLSDRDGHRCVYALRIDLVTGKPQGEAFAVEHFHGARRSLLRLTRSRLAAVGLSILADRMIFAMDEQTSDLFLANLP